MNLQSLSLHWAKEAGDKGNERKQKHIRFPLPAAADCMPPRGEDKGTVQAVQRDGITLILVLDAGHSLKFKVCMLCMH